MKKRIVFSALIGGAIGAVAMIILLVIFNGKAPMETKDLFSFVIATISIVIAALTVLGAVIVVTTWNDIDERTGKIVAKYEEQAKQGIEQYRQEKEDELAKNADERQKAIEDSADRVSTAMSDLMKKYVGMITRDKWIMVSLILFNFAFLFWIKWYKGKQIQSSKKSNDHAAIL